MGELWAVWKAKRNSPTRHAGEHSVNTLSRGVELEEKQAALGT